MSQRFERPWGKVLIPGLPSLGAQGPGDQLDPGTSWTQGSGWGHPKAQICPIASQFLLLTHCL